MKAFFRDSQNQQWIIEIDNGHFIIRNSIFAKEQKYFETASADEAFAYWATLTYKDVDSLDTYVEFSDLCDTPIHIPFSLREEEKKPLRAFFYDGLDSLYVTKGEASYLVERYECKTNGQRTAYRCYSQTEGELVDIVARQNNLPKEEAISFFHSQF